MQTSHRYGFLTLSANRTVLMVNTKQIVHQICARFKEKKLQEKWRHLTWVLHQFRLFEPKRERARGERLETGGQGGGQEVEGLPF